ncbi:hypothetical protein FHG87_005634 [Trinorchestia longiramus]|nr:hypothetical protein FHG87_005634 [Trinorchestia longiramus]
MIPPSTPASPNMIEDRMHFQASTGNKTFLPIITPSEKLRSSERNVQLDSISENLGQRLLKEQELREPSPCEQDVSSDNCSEMNKKNSETSKELTPSSQPPARKVRANHRRNLSLDFRAMGIELPPLSEVVPPTTLTSPPRRLPNIPEHNTHEISNTPQQPAITPKIKHVMRRILSRRIN